MVLILLHLSLGKIYEKNHFMMRIGKPACKHFIFIFFSSLLKFGFMQFCCYSVALISQRNLTIYNFSDLVWTLIIIAELCLTVSVSRNFVGFFSIVNLILSWYVLSFSKSSSLVFFFLLIYKYRQYIVCIISVL